MGKLTPVRIAGTSPIRHPDSAWRSDTTLNLEPTGQTDFQGCPTACRQCVDACPVGAIGETGKVHHNQCIRASGANVLLSHLLRDAATKEKFDFDTSSTR